ncbi:hypothetical protein JEO92_18285 [Proteus mirabilis]|nr:hypothetical protein [Proteus mirabilis]MBI6474392.1 hypothetical protein [Proteus mirabilis]MBI6509693.1 hypothetical protein [Proteus mirabilis]HDU8677089.1 hypothetical protein [Proteus mirabilis]HEI7948141.1 hypothetical protein [Proteus mirabilis]
MKRNIDDFDNETDFIISIVTVIAWVLIGVIVAIGYLTVETKGEGIMLNYITTFFTALSGMGIAVGFIVYILQKKDKKKDFHQKFKHYCNVITEEKKNIIELYGKLEKIEGELKNSKLEYITLRFRKDAYTFIIRESKNKDKELYSFFINSAIIQMMSQTCNDSLKISHNLYLPLKKLIDETITLERRLYAVFLRFNAINEKTDNIEKKEREKMLKYELFTKRKKKLEEINEITIPPLQ